MLYTEIANAPWLYIMVGFIILCCIAQMLFLIRTGYKRAVQLGVPANKIKTAMPVASAVSIFPTLTVLITFLVVTPLLGVPLPWLRFSVIGSPDFEIMMAKLGVAAVGEELVVGGYSATGFAAAATVMALVGFASILWTALAFKPIDRLYKTAGASGLGLLTFLGSAGLAGVFGYLTSISCAWGGEGLWTFLASFVVCGLLSLFARKKPAIAAKYQINSANMVIGMLAGMAFICLIA